VGRRDKGWAKVDDGQATAAGVLADHALLLDLNPLVSILERGTNGTEHDFGCGTIPVKGGAADVNEPPDTTVRRGAKRLSWTWGLDRGGSERKMHDGLAATLFTPIRALTLPL
jgi:hypothetical protein